MMSKGLDTQLALDGVGGLAIIGRIRAFSGAFETTHGGILVMILITVIYVQF